MLRQESLSASNIGGMATDLRETLGSGRRPAANQPSPNEALLAIHRSLSITHDKVVGELKKSVFANYETLADIAQLAEELEAALDEISRMSIKFEEAPAAPASVPTSPAVSQEHSEPVEEELPPISRQKDPEVEALKMRLAGPFLDLIDSTATRVVKQGAGLAELYGSIEALQSRPLYTVILSDAVIFCRQEAASGGRSPKKALGALFSRSSSPTKRVEDKLQIEKYLPFQATTLFDIADSKHVQSCIKLKSTAVLDLGTRAESVLLNAGAEKAAWMDAFKIAIDQFRSASKSAVSKPHPEPPKPAVLKKGERTEERQGGVARKLLEQLLDELVRAREVCAYDAAVEVIDKLNYQLQAQPLPEFKLRLADQTQLLVKYLLHEVSLPIVSRARLVGCIQNLLALKHSDSARDCFLRAKSSLIRSRLNAIAFDGDALRLVADTAAAVVGTIKHTIALFREAFKEDSLLAGLVLWVRVEIIAMLDLCKQLLAGSDSTTKLEAAGVLEDQVGQLNALGVDFVFVVKQLLA